MNIKPAPKPCPASGKQQYDTWQEAHDAIMGQRKMKNGGKDLRTLMEYRCRDCGKFHVGHTHKTDRAKARARQAEQPAAPAPQPRPLTAGQAARKARHEAKEAARHAARAKAFANYNESVRYSYSLLDKELALAAAKAGR